MDNKIGVLITGAGAPGAPGIIYCLRKSGDKRLRLIGVDIDPQAVGSSFVDSFYVIPPPESDDFIPSIFDICDKEKVKVILPLVTRELIPLSRAKPDLLSKGIFIPISDHNVMEILNDKHKLSVKARELDVSVPDFELVNNIDELISAVSKLGYPEKPVCIKPPISNGMRGFRILDLSKDRLYLLLKEKPTGVYSTLDEVIDILKKSNPFPPYLVMEYLPGKEYTVDAIADNGRMLVCIPRLREKIKNGISFDAKVVKNESIIEMTERLIAGLGVDGVIGFQFKERSDGSPCLIESNPRLQGTVILSSACGVNLPYLLVKMGLGEKVDIAEIRWGMSIKRYWGWVILDEGGLPYTF